MGVAVSGDGRQIAEDYRLLWDVKAPPDLAERIFEPDVIDHNPQPGQTSGIDGIKQIIALYHAVFPDLTLTSDDIVVEGDRVVLRWSATGTHSGDQLGMPPTNRVVQLTGIDILRITDGRIAERWGETNGLEMMQQVQ